MPRLPQALATGLVAFGAHSDGQPVNVSATCVPAPGAPGSWSAPCGCLWTSLADMASWMKLFFRDGQPADGKAQVVLEEQAGGAGGPNDELLTRS